MSEESQVKEISVSTILWTIFLTLLRKARKTVCHLTKKHFWRLGGSLLGIDQKGELKEQEKEKRAEQERKRKAKSDEEKRAYSKRRKFIEIL